MKYKTNGKKFPLWAFSSTTQDAQAAEGYFSTEEATLWEKDGTSKPIEIPFQGARILYTIDGGSSARDVKEYSATRRQRKFVLLRNCLYNQISDWY